MGDICFNNSLIRYGTLKLSVFFLLRSWRNRTSKDSEDGESSKREITWKSTERKSYTKYNHTRAIRITGHSIKNTVKLTIVGVKVKKILQGTPTNISPVKISQQSLGKAVKRVTKALPKSSFKKKSVVCALAKSFRVMNKEKKVISSGLNACDKEAIQNFYQRGGISLFMPGKQDVLTVREELLEKGTKTDLDYDCAGLQN